MKYQPCYAQVAALTSGIRDQKERSALQLMGRKLLSPADFERGFGEADAAERILQALLDLPTEQHRLQLLPDAFEQASTDDSSGIQVSFPSLHEIVIVYA